MDIKDREFERKIRLIKKIQTTYQSKGNWKKRVKNIILLKKKRKKYCDISVEEKNKNNAV